MGGGGVQIKKRIAQAIRRLMRVLAWRATNCQPLNGDIDILCKCGKAAGVISVDCALHGQCWHCGQHYSGAFYVRVSDEPLPWKETK